MHLTEAPSSLSLYQIIQYKHKFQIMHSIFNGASSELQLWRNIPDFTSLRQSMNDSMSHVISSTLAQEISTDIAQVRAIQENTTKPALS